MTHAATGIKRLVDNVTSVIYIDRPKLEYVIAAQLAGGHVMLADSHGVGKTSLARALAGSIRWPEKTPGPRGDRSASDVEMEEFSRVQCTVDLLPQDILGFSRYDASSSEFFFTKGPIFAHFVLCDEINLLTPKTQGSFFQAMEEQSVSIEGRTYLLQDPFFIIATMNLKGAHLFPLPAPQLDRFMVQISLGYPEMDDEAAIIRQHGMENSWRGFQPVVDSADLIGWQALVDQVSIHDEIIDYVVSCVRQTRAHPAVETGASPRSGIKVSRMARALAMIRGEDYVSIDTIKEIFTSAVAHRLVMQDPATPATAVVEEVLATVRVESRRRRDH